jgi:hypothetical protein
MTESQLADVGLMQFPGVSPGRRRLLQDTSYASIPCMRLTLIQLSTFAAKWARLGLTDEDLQSLEGILIANPLAGRVIPETGGLRKIRFAPPSAHTGKRGASRVIYAFIVAGQAAYLFTIYDKNERSDLSADEKKVFREVLKRLRDTYKD